MASENADESKGIDPVMVMRIPTIISGCIIAIIGVMQVIFLDFAFLSCERFDLLYLSA
jgi:hypothetical protein